MPEPQLKEVPSSRGPVPLHVEQNETDEYYHQPTGSRDGHHATIGAKTDAKASGSTGSFSAIALLKGIFDRLLGTLTVSVSNGNVTINDIALTSAPVTGNKTITTTPAAVFAGASKLAGRTYLYLPNPSNVYMRCGGAGISTTVGTRIEPGGYRIFRFPSNVAVDIYACLESGSVVADIEEGK